MGEEDNNTGQEDNNTGQEDNNTGQEDNNTEQKNESIEVLEKIIEERNNRKDDITACEWCGMTYPKGGWTYYKIRVRNMSVEKLVENIKKGIEFRNDDFEEHIICSDCHDHLEECKEC